MLKKTIWFASLALLIILSGFFIAKAEPPPGPEIESGSAIKFSSGDYIDGPTYTGYSLTAASATNSGSANALATNGTNCSAGQYPLGVDAAGNVESCTATGGASQWTASGANIYSSNSGNVGIGVTNPTSKLDVVGNINLNTNGSPALLSTYKGANSDGYNLWIGGGGQSAIGEAGLTYNGSYNTASGYQSLYSNTSGFYNTASGYKSLYSNSIGAYNTASGYQSLYSDTGGSFNTASGYKSLYFNTSGQQNTASGMYSLYFNTDGYSNTASGYQSLYANTLGYSNTASGLSTLYANTVGNRNTANGESALGLNTTGSYNTANGYRALISNTTGSYNTANGVDALFDLHILDGTGNNTALGYNTGRGIVTGINNTILGANVTGLSAALSNNVIIADGSGNQRIRVDSSGNVGIGTTNPTVKLEVNGGVKVTGRLTANEYNSSDGTPGITQDFVFTNNKDQTCTLVFKSGLLTSGVCE